MNNYFLILKLMLKEILRRKEKKQIALFILLGITYLIIIVGGIFFVYSIGKIFAQHNKLAELATLLLLIDFLVTILFGTIAAISQLFLSKDVEFFLGLPIKSSTVFWAKLTMVYLTEMVLSLALMLPLLITAGIAASAPILFYIIILVAVITVPLMSMVLVSVISMPIVLMITYFKNRGAAGSIVAILIFASVFSIYFYFTSSINGSNETDYTDIFNSITTLANVFYPIYMLMKLAILQPIYGLNLAVSILIEAGVFALAAVVFFFLSYFLSRFIYNKLTSRLLENTSLSDSKAKDYVYRGVTGTLIKKEWREILRNPAVAMQSLAGVFLCPLIIIIFLTTSPLFTMSAEEINFDMSVLTWPIGLMFLMMLGIGASGGVNICISREGQCILFLKTIPVSISTQIRAKHILYMILTMSSVTTGMIALIISTIIAKAFIWWAALLIFINTLVWAYFMTSLAIYFDFKNPRLNWKSIKEIIKRGKNSAVSVIWIFSSMIICSFLIVFVIIGKNTQVILGVFLIVYIVLGVAGAGLMHSILYKNVNKLYNNLRQ